MSTADYDQIEKLFNGSWQVDRDENMEEFMTAAEMSEEVKDMFRMHLQQHAIFIIKREGNSISQTIAMSGTEFKTALVLNEVFDWKEKEENPVYDTKFLVTFKDGVITFDVTPTAVDSGKRHLFAFSRNGNEVIGKTSVPDGPSVTATRIYKNVE